MPNNDEKKVLLKVTDLKQWFPLKKTIDGVLRFF